MAFLSALAAILLAVAPMTGAVAPTCPGSCTRMQESETTAFRTWAAGPASYLFSAKEKRIADALVGAGETVTPQQRAAFRHWFWERRDPSPGTPVNEFRDRFQARVDYVNKEFGDERTRSPGWRTSQGVLYVLLGPPTRIETREGHPYGEFEGTIVKVWVYELDDAAVVEAPFVATPDGVALLTTPDNLGMRGRLNAALARAAVDCIHNRDLPFTGVSPLADIPVRSDWPATGSLRRTEEGIEGEASVPLADLYGRADGDELHIGLRFALESPQTGAREPLGDVTVVIRQQDFERWHDRELTVALWFPDQDPDAANTDIVMIEVVSGRSVRLVEASGNGAIARAYAIDQLLGSARVFAGGGAAFAFIPLPPGGHIVDESLWVLRPPERFPGVVLEEPVPNLRLVRAEQGRN